MIKDENISNQRVNSKNEPLREVRFKTKVKPKTSSFTKNIPDIFNKKKKLKGDFNHNYKKIIDVKNQANFSELYLKVKSINESLEKHGFYIDTNSGELYHIKQKDSEALCNIIFIPLKEIVIWDGLNTESEIELYGLLNSCVELPIIRINVKDLKNSDWIEENWGFQCRLYPVSKCYDRVRDAIKILCLNIDREVFIKQLGWLKLKDKYMYIHGNGVIGYNDVNINIDDSLNNFSLDIDKNICEKDAYKIALKLLKIAPLSTTIPLFSFTLLSSISTLLKDEGIEPKFALWLEGETGSRKTTLANIFGNYFNRSDGFANPPSNFKDTSTSLEIKMFEYKDSVLLIDDYAPTDNAREKKDIDSKVNMILRMYGDRISKSRSNVKLTKQKEFVPRGLPLITGEDFIGIHSAMARCICIFINKNDVNLTKLSKRQENPLEMPTILNYFLQWIATIINSHGNLPHLDIDTFRIMFRESHSIDVHGRLVDAAFFLYYSYKLFLDYGLSLGVLNREEYINYESNSLSILIDLILKQQSDMQHEKPLVMYLKTLQELIVSSQIVLFKKGIESSGKNHGWYDDTYYYLMPNTVYNCIVKFWRNRNKEFPLSMKRLHRLLVDNNIAEPDSEPNKIVTKIKVSESERPRLLKLNKKEIYNYLNLMWAGGHET